MILSSDIDDIIIKVGFVCNYFVCYHDMCYFQFHISPFPCVVCAKTNIVALESQDLLLISLEKICDV